MNWGENRDDRSDSKHGAERSLLLHPNLVLILGHQLLRNPRRIHHPEVVGQMPNEIAAVFLQAEILSLALRVAQSRRAQLRAHARSDGCNQQCEADRFRHQRTASDRSDVAESILNFVDPKNILGAQ